MKLSPLNQRHLDLDAKMADFGGWMMPIDYPATGTLLEHAAVRNSVGIFDVSHLGKASVKGEGALDFLNKALTNDLNRITDGQAQYTMICNESGGVIDDLIVYRISAEDFFLVPNASNTSDVVAALLAKEHGGLVIENLHSDFGVIALQGPHSLKVLQSLGIESDLEYMNFSRVFIAGVTVILCRTGYTGEYGFEILPSWQDTPIVWDVLVEAMKDFSGAVSGLGARDTLRTEMGYPLHGHELSLEITPVQASASWAVGWKKDSFTGDEVLRREKSEGAARTSRALKCSGRGIPRAGMAVKNANGEVLGEVTSGTFSPTLKVGIALALLAPGVEIGDQLLIDIRGRDCEAEVIKLPFLPSHVR